VPKVAHYSELSINTSLSNFANSYSLNGTAGLRVKFRGSPEPIAITAIHNMKGKPGVDTVGTASKARLVCLPKGEARRSKLPGWANCDEPLSGDVYVSDEV
jgi:hypothetical protein